MPEPTFIDIVFDGPPSHESGQFIEVENSIGASVSAGTWIDRGGGDWVLRLTPEDVIAAAYQMPTETGWYLDKHGDPIYIDGDHYKRAGQYAYNAHHFRNVAPFVRLVPAPGVE
jgi:hypothetical protein